MHDWHVLIEETVDVWGSTQGRHWCVSWTSGPVSHPDAVQLAGAVADGYRPAHPRVVRSRSVFRHGDDWVVRIAGTTETFHFRVSVVQLISHFDHTGQQTWP
ncbi:hypothetical protein EV193_101142 [Herbihabitans rhizosphaerae]|uniref:Uncharacterized protein n=1 Tax=Herbihabitans rhizosphaerae TaxID=1872711 RepID=A0A4Q7L4R3_9PSEU|nr:hypothetical protein [Herbihabitans rhizosphaerae]RZS44267.1 hypothetical protein EV193_101142 [Herbihabitans rhizosphaerae]